MRMIIEPGKSTYPTIAAGETFVTLADLRYRWLEQRRVIVPFERRRVRETGRTRRPMHTE